MIQFLAVSEKELNYIHFSAFYTLLLVVTSWDSAPRGQLNPSHVSSYNSPYPASLGYPRDAG